MILIWLISVPMAGGILAWFFSRWSERLTRWISLIAMSLELAVVLVFWSEHSGAMQLAATGPWLAEVSSAWVPSLGIGFHLAMDGLSLLLTALAAFLGIMSVAVSWTEIRDRVGFFHFNLLFLR